MREIVVYCPSCNKVELLRMISRFGCNTLGVRIVDSLGLIERAMIGSGCLECPDIRTAEECMLDVYSALNSGDCPEYFKIAKSLEDAKTIYSSLCVMRTQSPKPDCDILNALASDNKNKALKSLIAGITFNDSISYIKKIINSRQYDGLELKNSKVITLKEFKLDELEKALLRKISNESFEEKSLKDVFNLERIHFAKAYGSSAETEWIISTILKEGYKIDDCSVIYTDALYPELFYTLSQLHHIPMTFASGISVRNSNPSHLLKLIQEWSSFGLFGIEALKAIINSPSFNKAKLKEDIKIESDYQLDIVVKAAASLRLSFDSAKNNERISKWKKLDNEEKFSIFRSDTNQEKYTVAVEKIAEILNEGMVEFINGYSKISREIDPIALNLIAKKLELFKDKGIPLSDDVYNSIFESNVMQSLSKEGALHIVPIEKALSSLRKHVFVCGLTASIFPGRPQENPLFSDAEIKLIKNDNEDYSKRNIEDRNALFDDIIRVAKQICSDIYLSYPYYNTAELKVQNPSSRFFEISSGRSVLEIGFLSSGITPGISYKDGNTAREEEIKEQCEQLDSLGLKSFNRENSELSPSAIEAFVECPRRFYLQYIEKIPNESQDDTTQLMPAADFGTLVHSIMDYIVDQESCNNKLSDDDIKNEVSRRAEAYFIKRAPAFDFETERELKDLESVIMATVKMHRNSKGNETIAREEQLRCSFKFENNESINLKGYPDRVDKLSDGSYKIIDYKTGRTPKHDPQKIETFIQAFAYADMYEKTRNVKVSRCEFWYPRLGANGVKASDWDIDAESKYREIMSNLNTAISTGEFARNPGDNEEHCRYCNFKDICKWPEDGEVKGENNV